MNVQRAKTIPIPELLAALGHVPVRETLGEKWYLSPFRNERTESFKVSADGRAFYDHGDGRHGNVLDFAVMFFETDVSGALREMDRLMGSPVQRAGQRTLFPSMASDDEVGLSVPPVPAPAARPESPPERRAAGFTDVTIKAVTDSRLLKYLQERAIPPALARVYLREIRYTYHDKRYFALAFPNDDGAYEMRNPYFQGVYGKKAISTLHVSGAAQASVAIFEGVFDFLSALVWDRAALEGTAIVMNSVAMKAETLAQLRRIGAPVVRLYLDNDRAGQTLAEELQQELTGVSVVDCSGVYEGFKDFNECLQARQRQERTQKGGILA